MVWLGAKPGSRAGQTLRRIKPFHHFTRAQYQVKGMPAAGSTNLPTPKPLSRQPTHHKESANS